MGPLNHGRGERCSGWCSEIRTDGIGRYRRRERSYPLGCCRRCWSRVLRADHGAEPQACQPDEGHNADGIDHASTDSIGCFLKLRWILDAPTTDIIRELVRQAPDYRIGSILNSAGKRTGQDNTWNEARIRAFRSNHRIELYREGERAERRELNELEAAQVLGTCRMLYFV